MNGKRFSAYAITVVITLIATACEFSFSTARIAEAKLAKEVNENKEAVNPTTTFSSTDKVIHAVVYLANVPDSTKVKAKWIAVKAEGVKENQSLGDVEIATEGKNIVDFTYTTPPTGLPPGEYKVEIYLNPQPGKEEKPDETLTFTVTSDSSNAGSSTLSGAAGNSSNVAIAETIISLEPDGSAVETVPSDAAKVYGRARLTGDLEGAIVWAKWVAVDADGIDPETVLVTVEPLTLKAGQNAYTTNLNITRRLAPGEYRVDFYVNNSDAPAMSAPFNVSE